MNTKYTISIPNQGNESQQWAAGPRIAFIFIITASLTAAVLFSTTLPASAATAPIDLGTAESYSVLSGQTVTNTGPSVLSGNLGVSPGNTVTGFPPGVTGKAINAGNAAAAQANSDLVIAYDETAGRAPTASVNTDLVGRTFRDGTYSAPGPLELSGKVTLDAEGDPNAVFIFQAASTLITATSSSVELVNGAQACNVFWQVGSSATLGTNTKFVGSILALTSISLNTGATVQGRALARNGSVTLDNNTFSDAVCAPAVPPSSEPAETATGIPSVLPTESGPGMPTETPTDTPSEAPTDTPTGTPSGTPTDTPSVTPSYDVSGSASASPAASGPDGTGIATTKSSSSAASNDDEATTEKSAKTVEELARTGASDFTRWLFGLSVLLIFAGSGLFQIRRIRSRSTH